MSDRGTTALTREAPGWERLGEGEGYPAGRTDGAGEALPAVEPVPPPVAEIGVPLAPVRTVAMGVPPVVRPPPVPPVVPPVSVPWGFVVVPSTRPPVVPPVEAPVLPWSPDDAPSAPQPLSNAAEMSAPSKSLRPTAFRSPFDHSLCPVTL